MTIHHLNGTFIDRRTGRAATWKTTLDDDRKHGGVAYEGQIEFEGSVVEIPRNAFTLQQDEWHSACESIAIDRWDEHRKLKR